MRLRYRLLNVFAHDADPFSGNPLCVFEDGSGLTDEQLLGLARQFNLSETTFLVPPADGADAGVRIFTTTFEMPFAGHPTLGTAHVARDLLDLGDDLTLSMPAGVIPVVAAGDRWTLTANAGRVEADLEAADVARALNLEPGELLGPVQQVSVGTSQVIAHAASVDVVRRARANPELLGGYAGMGARGGERRWSTCGRSRGRVGSRRAPSSATGRLSPRIPPPVRRARTSGPGWWRKVARVSGR